MVLESEVLVPREYHNLRGIVRDIERALREGDYSEVATFVDLLDDFADAREGIDEDTLLDDAEGTSGQECLPNMELRDQPDGTPLDGTAQGHDSLRSDALDAARGLGPAVERIARLSASAGGIIRDSAPVVRTAPQHRAVGGRRGKN